MGGKTQTSTSSNNSTYTPAALSNLQEIYSKAAQAASTPYSPYTGQLTAGLTGTQQSGIAGTNAAAGAAQPWYDQAQTYATQGASSIDPSQISKYMNPYTQSVIDATKANFAEDNGQQQQQVIGNAALKGALGGDRVGVAQAELARQQNLAQAPVIAGLQQQNYTQALQAAQADRSAAANAASQFGALGSGAQSAALQGAQAQLQAGGVEQNTNQNALNAQYQQYLQQLAYPYQNAQFLASIGLPASSAMGGTTSGTSTSTAPGPNPFTQALGLGISAAGMFSDERVKENKEAVGKTFDGQTIYRFNYKGSPTTQIGLMAQEVERKSPNAVGQRNGIKTVEYKTATDDAAERGHFSNGGEVGPYDFITSARGYVPAPVQISMGSSPQPQQSSGGGGMGGSSSKPVDDVAPITSALSGLKGKFASSGTPDYGQTSNIDIGGYSMPVFGQAGGASGTTTGFLGLGGLYADGGAVDLEDRFSPVKDAIANGTFDPVGANYNKFDGAILDAGTPFRINQDPGPDSSIQAVPDTAGALPRQKPVPLPPEIVGPETTPDLPETALAFDQTGRPGTSPMTAAVPTTSQAQPANTMGGFNPFNLSDKTRQAMIAAGLGMAASRSPFALSAIGEGGLHGLKSYSEANKAEQEAAEKKTTQAQNQQRIDMEAKRLAQSAEQFAKNYGQAERRLKLAEDKTPEGYRAAKDGSYEPIPGGPADPEVIRKAAEAKRVPGTAIDDETASFVADQVLAGDSRALIGFGRGAQGAENLIKIRGLVAQKAKEQGLDPSDILNKVAIQSGNTAAQRTFGTQTARMAVNATEAQGAIELGRTASAAVPRTKWVPANEAIQAYQSRTSNPYLAKFGAANLAIINTYARAISPTGVPTVHDKEHAEHLLSTAMGPEAYNAVLDQMNEEIKIAHAAPQKAKKEIEDIRKGKTTETLSVPKVGEVRDGWRFKGGNPADQSNWAKVAQ